MAEQVKKTGNNGQCIGEEEIEKKCVTISGHNFLADVNDIIVVFDAKNKCKNTKHGTIIKAIVTQGYVSIESPDVTIKAQGSPVISDKICHIEIDNKPVNGAGVTQKVGLCLANTKLSTIRKNLDKIRIY